MYLSKIPVLSKYFHTLYLGTVCMKIERSCEKHVSNNKFMNPSKVARSHMRMCITIKVEEYYGDAF